MTRAPLLPPTVAEPVPFDEVAAVLAAAASRLPGRPPALISANSRHLAATLEQAGFQVVRRGAPDAQLTL